MSRTYAIRREMAPTCIQRQTMIASCGAVRKAQNWCLDYVKCALDRKEGVSWSAISLHKAWLAGRSEAAPWYAEYSKETFQWGCERAAAGLKNWSDSRKGRRNGRAVGFPQYRKRGRNDSLSYTKAVLRPEGKRIHIPRIGEVELKEKAILPKNARVLRTVVKPDGDRWFVVLCVREDAWEPPKPSTHDEGETCIGVDLGIGDHFAILDDGTKIPNPRWHKKSLRELRRDNKALARKQPGSENWEKARLRLARTHRRTRNQRSDWLHKLTTSLIKNHDHVVIEHLSLSGLCRTHLRRSFYDAALGEFRRQMEYKAEWYGTRLTVADRWFPSSRLCSVCKEKNTALTLSDRLWSCLACGAQHDRDVNAAMNLRDLAGSIPVTACGDDTRPRFGAVVGEAGIDARDAGSLASTSRK